MALNYAGIHLVAENFVTRPKSNQPYINRLADTIHGAAAYVIPHKVENRHRQQIEALCGSPQIKQIRTIMANSRASFGTVTEPTEPAPPQSPAAAIAPTARQVSSAKKQVVRNLSVEQQEAAAQERLARRNMAEGEAAVAEARRLSSAKKAGKTPAPKSAAPSGGYTAKGFVTARSGGGGATTAAKTTKKVQFTATPRALAKDFDGEAAAAPAPAPRARAAAKGLNLTGRAAGGGNAAAANVGGGGAAAAAAAAPEAPEPAVTASRADNINATIAQTEGAAGRVKVIAGKGGKGFQPAFIGDDGEVRGYKSADVSMEDLDKMTTEFTKVRAKLTDKKEKQDITNYLSRIKGERDSR